MAKRRARLADLDIPELVPPKETLYEKLIRQAVNDLTGANKKEWPEIPIYPVQKAFKDSTTLWRGFVGGRAAGKALELETPIPTPTGWTTMGKIQPGDTVFDERGVPCRVVAATEVMLGRPCYEMVFSDGTKVIADAQHEWVADGETFTTEQLAADSEPSARTISGPNATFRIEHVTPTASVPVRCIQVDSPSHQYLVTKAMIPTHNSFIGAYDMLTRAKGGRLYLVTNPTYPLLRDSTYRSYLDVANKLGCFKRANKQEFYMIIATRDGGEAQINFRSADRPEGIARGPNYSGWHGDEASLCSEELPKLAIAMLREAGELGWLSLTFTPKGKGHWTYRWFYDRDKSGKELPKEDTELFQASTRDNPYLAKTFYKKLADTYVEGSSWARQELEGSFEDVSGLKFQPDWFTEVEQVPFDAMRVRYWDKAAADASSDERGDWSVGVLVARTPDGLYWIEDVVRGQWSPHARNQIMKETARKDAADYNGTVSLWIEQEPGSGGKESALASLDQLAAYGPHLESPRTNKEARSVNFQAQAEGGRIRVLKSPWLTEFVYECISFPNGKHDDQVDACSGAINKLAMMAGCDTSGDIIAYPCAPDSERTTVSPDGASNVVQPEMDLLEYLRIYAGEAKEDSGPRGWVSRWINRN